MRSGVNPRKETSETRWAVTTAYRNPGAPSHGRWINDSWALHDGPALPLELKDHTWR